MAVTIIGMCSNFVIPTRTATISPTSVRRVCIRVTGVRAAAAGKSTAAEEETTKREPRGIMKPKKVSKEMTEFLGGVDEIPRTQALKLIWAYIKHHDLQDPENKKVIVCDENLKKIFAGKDRVGFLEIAGLISPHFLKLCELIVKLDYKRYPNEVLAYYI